VILLKLGGSLISDKKKKFSVRRGVLDRLAAEIKAGAKEKLIIVHGGGAFGHPVASEYELHRGFKDKAQTKGIVLTRIAMNEMNNRVIDALARRGIPAVSVQPSANVICRGGRIEQLNAEIIRKFLELDITPVLYGDVVLDEKQGFCILSGDQIISYISKIFKPSRIILATDVDGIFDKNPKKFRSAKLIEEINPANLEKILQKLEASPRDVTGEIKGKLLELVALARKGFEAQIINAIKPGRLKKALLGQQIIGTTIKKGRYKWIQNDRCKKA